MRAFVSFLLGFCAIVATGEPRAQQAAGRPVDAATARAANSRFAGTWKLASQEIRDSKGQPVPLTPNNIGRLGYIVYDPAGYMGVAIQSPGRQKFAGARPTPDEARAALVTYTSYWGSFAVNDDATVVTHQTFGSLSTAFSGTNMVRGFTIAGNRLTLRPPVNAEGNQPSLTWERQPDLPNLTPLHRKLIGVWKLISNERRRATGELITSNPGQTGFIIYTASGHMMVHLMQPYRRRTVGGSATPEESVAAFQSYNSYFGPYTVDESGQYVVHHLAGASNPNNVGSDFQRFVEFSGRRLTLRTPVRKEVDGEVKNTIVWERLGD
jgi:hypothetical protein